MYYDTTVTGFGVRVSPAGTKTFALMYGANRKLHSIGRVGVISLSDARREAKRILAEHTLGKNRPQNVSFQVAQELFLDESSQKNKERTTRDYKRYLDRYFKYGRTRLSEITQQDIKNRVAKLNDRPSEKFHAFVTLRRLFRWAVNNRYLEQNPMDGLSPPPQKQGTTILERDSLNLLLSHALERKDTFGRIVALLILTGQRRGEIVSLQWDWINGGTITFPDWITKNKRTHTIPMSNRVQEIVMTTPRASDVYLFPASRIRSETTTTFNSWSKAKAEFDKEVGFSDYTLHDLRRSFASSLAQLETPIHITEKILNHISGVYGGVVGVYNRYSYMNEMKRTLQNFEDWLASQ